MSERIIVVSEQISFQEVVALCEGGFGDMVKGVVDVRLEVMTLGGELHSDEEQVLLDRGSRQQDLWGINLYHELPRDEWIEFDSMINIRPSQGNRSRGVEDEATRDAIRRIVERLVS